ncbi:hypothetical protein ACFUCV_03745 [Specibacter sp. NPDC057265]|uniref:hypothetical protein n=1 Tax=Specibacter sp. NPDC057265 TaxID=3346075 RepID=UPI003627D624
MSMLGLDPLACRDLVQVLNRSAQQLEQAGTHLNSAIARTSWRGADSQRFRSQWPANRQRLNRAARELEGAATQLLREIAEQERASAVDGGNSGGQDGGDSLWDSLVNAGADLWEDFGDGVDGAVDSLRDGLDWLAGGITKLPGIRSTWNFAEQLGQLGAMGFAALIGNPPSLSAVVAQLVLAGGTGVDAWFNAATGGGVDLRLFEDGEPYAGEPIAVGENLERNALTLPTSASAIFQGVIDAYDAAAVPGTEDGEVRIVQVEQPDGSFAYIVNIPGTEDWGAAGGGQSRDLSSNLMVMASQSSAAQQAVALAMARAGIPPGAPVMLTGHSQGGMLAVALASDPAFMDNYNVTNVMTVGSPVDGANIDPRVNVLQVQHAGDVVPQLDLGGVRHDGSAPEQPANVSVVTMANPPRNAEQNAGFGQSGGAIGAGAGPWIPGMGEENGRNAGTAAGELASDAINNHDFVNYRESMANTGANPGITDYENDPSMRVFFSDDPDRVSAVDVATGRR